jgi:hypothetical protein
VEAHIGSWGETNPTLDIRNSDESSTPLPYWWTNASVVGDRCLGHG